LSPMRAWQYFEAVELVVEWLTERFDPIIGQEIA